MKGDPARKVDVRPFRKPHVGSTEADLGAIMYGFRFNMWYEEKIPTWLVRELQEAYPESFPPVRLERLGDNESALKSHDEALEEKPGDHAILNSKGMLLARMDRHDEALSCFDEVLGEDPNNYRVQINKSRSLIKLDRHEEAMKCLDWILDTLGDSPTSVPSAMHVWKMQDELPKGQAGMIIPQILHG